MQLHPLSLIEAATPCHNASGESLLGIESTRQLHLGYKEDYTKVHQAIQVSMESDPRLEIMRDLAYALENEKILKARAARRL